MLANYKIIFPMAMLVLAITSCHTYYKTQDARSSNSAETASSIDSLQHTSRYFILRNGNDNYAIKNAVLSEDRKTLRCQLDTLAVEHTLHLLKGIRGQMRYKGNTEAGLNVLNEVHFFTPYDSNAKAGNYLLSLDKVQKIEVTIHDKKRTTNSYVIGALGYTLGAMLLAVVIIAATKSSCPFVSTYNENGFALQGEIYGGAIYPQLARHDYMPLKMSPLADGTLQLKISNELKEHQFTDIAELWVINHDKNSKVYADEKGNLYSITLPQPPVTASLNNNKDVTATLTKAEDNAMLYMDDTSASNATNEVVMNFNKPGGAVKAKLLLSLKNSYFLDLLYGELAKGFGSYYNTYVKKQRNTPVAELLQWTKNQQIPLQISVKTETGWRNIADITTIGPVATRNIVVPVDLSKTTGPVTAIKLSAGFMFWEIDYAGIDYSDGNSFTVEKFNPYAATDETGKDVLLMLQNEDGNYLSQPDIGNAATIVYKIPALQDNLQTRDYILHTKGYYEHVREFTNKPNVGFLKQFTKPNAFPVYGLELYKKMNTQGESTLTKSN